jgi:hypothetical protein
MCLVEIGQAINEDNCICIYVSVYKYVSMFLRYVCIYVLYVHVYVIVCAK